MKKRSKALLVILSVGFLWLGVGPTALVTQAQEVVQEKQTISPRSDIIGWRQTIIDGYVYKRQYNYTKQEWIGEWERVY